MPRPKKPPLMVLANPWIHLDHLGRPAGACPMDLPPGQKGYVGASIDRESTQILDMPGKHELRSHVQDTVWKFSSDPQPVPCTPFYIARLRTGELFPADMATAKAAGLKAFMPPAEALAKAKADAAKAWDAEHGAGAYAELEREREEDAKELAKAKADAEKAAADAKAKAKSFDEAAKADAARAKDAKKLKGDS